MGDITLRSVKGSNLSPSEVDANFTELVDRVAAALAKANSALQLDSAGQVPFANLQHVRSMPKQLTAGRDLVTAEDAGRVLWATWDGVTQNVTIPSDWPIGESALILPVGNGRVRVLDAGAGLVFPDANYSEGQGRPVNIYRGLDGKVFLGGGVPLSSLVPVVLPDFTVVPASTSIATDIGVDSILFVANAQNGVKIPRGSEVVASPNDGRIKARIDYTNNRVVVERGATAVSQGGPANMGFILTHPQGGGVQKTGASAITWTAPAGSAVVTQRGAAPSGTAQVGAVLTANRSTASNTNGATPPIKWQSASAPDDTATWTDISGATATTFTLTTTEKDKYVRSAETITGTNGSTTFAPSQPTAVIAAASTAPVRTTALTAINGYAAQGRSVNFNSGPNGNGGWTNSPASYRYAWYRYDANNVRTKISGATGTGLNLWTDDVNNKIGYSIVAIGADGVESVEEFGPLTSIVVAPAGSGSLSPNPPNPAPVVNTNYTLNWTLPNAEGGEVVFYKQGSDTDNVTIPPGATSGTVTFRHTSAGTIGRHKLYGSNRAQVFSGNTFTPTAS